MSGPTNTSRAELRADFSYNDSDRDGYISFGEFTKLLNHLDAGVSDEEAHIGFAEVDTDRNGLIDFAEFVAWWEEQ